MSESNSSSPPSPLPARAVKSGLGCVRIGGLLAALLLARAPAAAASYEQSLSLSALRMFNVGVSASVHDPSIVLPSLSALTDRFYLNGYNRVDSSGNLGEGGTGLPSRTGYFGFSSNSQVNLAAGTLAMNVLLPATNSYLAKSGATGDLSYELNYTLLRRFDSGRKLGLEVRGAPIGLDLHDDRQLTRSVTLVSDTYKLGGVVPPVAPYSAGYAVIPFTPRIGDIPTRTVSDVSASYSGSRRFQVNGWLVRLGGVWRVVDRPRLRLEAHGGPALVAATSKFSVTESVSATSVGGLGITARASRYAQHLGWYAGGTAGWRLHGRWSVVAGADYLDAGAYSVHARAASARFNLSQGLLLNLGIARSF